MITITTTSDTVEAKAHSIMREAIMRDCNLNGAAYRIVRGDFDEIDGADEYTGAALYAMIFQHSEHDLC